MIKASELRIGNWVQPFITILNRVTDHKPFQVTGLYIRQCEAVGGENHNAHPVPLTPEWLSKMGFFEQNPQQINPFERHDPIYSIGEDNDWSVKFVHCSYGGTIEDYIVFYQSFDSIRTIRYVHELQNLYFAITGEELIIDGH